MAGNEAIRSSNDTQIRREIQSHIKDTKIEDLLLVAFSCQCTFPSGRDHPHPLKSQPIRSIFRGEDAVGHSIKSLTEVQLDNIHSSSVVHRCSHCIIKGWLVRLDLPLGETSSAVLNHLLVLHIFFPLGTFAANRKANILQLGIPLMKWR